MYFVYFIKSLESGVVYVGITQDVQRRLKEHNSGKSRYTKAHLPWELIYTEGPYETEVAREKEKFYKRTSNKRKILDSL